VSTISRSQRLALPVALIAALLLLVPAAFAAKGGGTGGSGKPSGGSAGGSGSIKLVILTSSSTDGLPHYGDTITFNVSDPASATPHLQLQCFQSGTMVYTSVTGYYAGYPWPWTQDMTLSTAAWTGGGASCTATLYHFTAKGTAYDGTLNFAVAA
jgi:hypothetical protein